MERVDGSGGAGGWEARWGGRLRQRPDDEEVERRRLGGIPLPVGRNFSGVCWTQVYLLLILRVCFVHLWIPKKSALSCKKAVVS